MARIRSPDGARYNPLRVVFWHVCGLIHVRARLEWPAKRVHWQDMFGGLLPEGDIVYPRPLFGKAAYLEDREIIFIDSPIAETVHSTAFYEPLKDVPTLNVCSAPGDYANQIPTAPARGPRWLSCFDLGLRALLSHGEEQCPARLTLLN